MKVVKLFVLCEDVAFILNPSQQYRKSAHNNSSVDSAVKLFIVCTELQREKKKERQMLFWRYHDIVHRWSPNIIMGLSKTDLLQ